MNKKIITITALLLLLSSLPGELIKVRNYQSDQISSKKINRNRDDLLEISYHDGIASSAAFQEYNNGYGTVFDLNIYENATLEMIDFHHSQYENTDYPHNYHIHVINWETKERLVLLENLTTTVTDDWETEISLGSIPAVDSVGIFLEPLSYEQNDAYPDLDYDASLDYSSFIVDVANYSDNNPGLDIGDFLLDLWINVPVLTVIQEDFTEGIPGSWTLIDADGDSFDWEFYDEDGYDDSTCVRSASYINGIGVLNPDNYLVLPKIRILNNDYSLKYWVKPFSDYFYAEHYMIVVSTILDSIGKENYQDVIYEETLQNTGWQQIVIPLADYEGQDIYLAFEHCESSDQYYIMLDDISVSEALAEELIAEFSAAPISGTNPLEVQFTDLSVGNPISWEWDFGDFGSSPGYEQNPIHTYENVGNYTVTLTVSDGSNDDTEIKTNYISVYDEELLPPTNLQAAVDDDDVYISWSSPPGFGLEELDEDFESYEDFAIEFAPWTLIDVDQSPTWGIEGYNFLHSEEPMSFIIFNPSEVDPPIDDMQPHSGDKMAACFASTNPPNNDWLITPLLIIEEDSQFSFWARSYTDEWGLERFKVGISTTDTEPSNFSIVSEGEYIQAPINWTQYSFDLSDYFGQDIYIGINCISDDAFIFFIDGFVFNSGTRNIIYNDLEDNLFISENKIKKTSKSNISNKILRKTVQKQRSRDLLGYNIFKEGLQLNPEILTDRYYDDHGLEVGTYQYAVSAVYDEGESVQTNPVSATIEEPDIEVDFAANPTSGIIPLEVQFEDLSVGNSVTWEWNFGDGTTSYEQDPNHIYESVGYYTVSLIVSDGTNSFSEIKSNYIYVYDESLFPPENMQATAVDDSVRLTWDKPDPEGETVFSEDFENGIQPEGWSFDETCTDSSYAVPGFWTVNSFSGYDFSPFGNYHCGLWFSYEHQDEWLIMPETECEQEMTLKFRSTVYEGSSHNDHYYVKVSSDGGSTWDILWDASGLSPAGWNLYDYPYSIGLNSYAGENIKIAFNAVDGPDNDGLWFAWFVDKISLKSNSRCIRFEEKDFTFERISNKDNITKKIFKNCLRKIPQIELGSARALSGYNVYRNDTLINGTAVQDLFYDDPGLLPGTYFYNITALYDEGESAKTDTAEITISASPVYPGDTNNDGDVDGTDIEYIGIYWREQGNSREEDEQSFNWTGFTHPGGWSEFSAAYADCNGDGEVNITDVLGICVNWEKSHSMAQEITISPEMIEAARDNFMEIYEGLGNSEIEIKIKNHIAELFGLQQIEFIEQDFLFQNYPNPFKTSNSGNAKMNISYQIAAAGLVELKIFNIRGQLVNEPVKQFLERGKYTVLWDGKDMSGKNVGTGIYLYKLSLDGKTVKIRKCLVLR